jgi:phage-related protein
VKTAIFHPSVRKELHEFPEDIRREAGKAIRELQKGVFLDMPLSKAMPSVEQGVFELRLKDRNGQYRIFYYLKHADGILIFHAFTKKTQKTPDKEIALGRKRLRELIYGE